MTTLLATFSISPLSQILAVLSGFLVMAGAAFGYRKWDVEGSVAAVFAFFGVALVIFGVGGTELLNGILR
jgi:hypothetical protein